MLFNLYLPNSIMSMGGASMNMSLNPFIQIEVIIGTSKKLLLIDQSNNIISGEEGVSK